MAELRPYPFGALVRRALRELEREDKVFDLPLERCFFGDPQRDLSADFHGRRIGCPLGPAAGPHAQMAQNLALSWLAGCRVFELKTVQILDQLEIPRPCIDMQTVGYNVEWSQELRLEQSLEEYVKGSMLIEILRASGRLPRVEGFGGLAFDMSVGYDLAGIRHPRVAAFIEGLKDARALVERLREQIPGEFAQLRELDFETRISDTLTLSTFHGCPPDEIERICEHLLERHGLHCIVKLNPTLLGPEVLRGLLHEELGYTDIHVPESAFERDTRWEEMTGFVGRLGRLAEGLGLGFGVKFTNTLVVENHRNFFPPEEREMYLSGQPLHVLAMHLVRDFRRHFGSRFPISFSAGVERANFADCLALGLVPVTVCTDLLKPGGYGRASRYFPALAERMDAAGARSLGDFIIRAYDLGAAALTDLAGLDEAQRATCERALADGRDLRAAAGEELHVRWVAAAVLRNTEHYVPLASADPRYGLTRNSKLPKKLDRALELFDCTTCDKCVPVCPNDSNFVYDLPRLEQPIVKLRPEDGGWVRRSEGSLVIEAARQYGNFADFCNHCGNCDVFCPDDGGPYVVKPRFFGSAADFELFAELDGFVLEPGDGEPRLRGRFGGREYALTGAAGRLDYSGPGFQLSLDPADPEAAPRGRAEGEVDLTYLHLLRWIQEAVYGEGRVNYLNSLSR